PDPRDVAVAEDAEAALDQPVLDAVALGVLDGQESDQSLAHGESDRPRRAHELLLSSTVVSGRRGSTSWPSQVSRTQAWAGSSLMGQARSAPGPAITLR